MGLCESFILITRRRLLITLGRPTEDMPDYVTELSVIDRLTAWTQENVDLLFVKWGTREYLYSYLIS